ncbi:MAG TPA: hypothetical protein PLF30_01745 [Candidatus Moranbacteria bacterium]|jgi:hypothetical protein|nr:hypothetical protein [Candidatus Moranbacteria bacterium]HPX94258.1 hypothetical protein [Candidatus Moranbacteria bacterium]HQB59709.1 hypothetical protein [Candidatus Moranbacteria bacterium]
MKKELVTLNESVLRALDFFSENKPPQLNLEEYPLPFVVGSGNAYNTGTILFSNRAAVFANESNFRNLLKSFKEVISSGFIKHAIIISASGEKDSVWEIEEAKKAGLSTLLLTCSAASSAAKIADKVISYRKVAEPYTYNVSTYLGMILSSTKEDPQKIKDVILNFTFPDNFNSYESYAFVLPDGFLNICPMLDIKKSELFGPHLSLRAFSEGYARHAKFVVPSEKELVISAGCKNEYFGLPQHRWEISLPAEASFALMLSLTYFIVGKIQESKKPYFMENIENYCSDYGPKAYRKNEKFDVIVPGN